MNLIHEKNRIYMKNESDTTIAEVTFPNITEGLVDINHTFVDDSLRGQGIASKLIEAVASMLKKENKKARASCSYAVKWFEKHPEFHDVFQK